MESAGSGIVAGAFMYGSESWATVAGWVFVVSAGIAWYTATGIILAGTAGPDDHAALFKYSMKANKPGAKPTRTIELDWAEPGIKHGQ